MNAPTQGFMPKILGRRSLIRSRTNVKRDWEPDAFTSLLTLREVQLASWLFQRTQGWIPKYETSGELGPACPEKAITEREVHYEHTRAE